MTGYNLPSGCRERDLPDDYTVSITAEWSCETCKQSGTFDIDVFPFDEWEEDCPTEGCKSKVFGYYEPYEDD